MAYDEELGYDPDDPDDPANPDYDDEEIPEGTSGGDEEMENAEQEPEEHFVEIEGDLEDTISLDKTYNVKELTQDDIDDIDVTSAKNSLFGEKQKNWAVSNKIGNLDRIDDMIDYKKEIKIELITGLKYTNVSKEKLDELEAEYTEKFNKVKEKNAQIRTEGSIPNEEEEAELNNKIHLVGKIRKEINEREGVLLKFYERVENARESIKAISIKANSKKAEYEKFSEKVEENQSLNSELYEKKKRFDEFEKSHNIVDGNTDALTTEEQAEYGSLKSDFDTASTNRKSKIVEIADSLKAGIDYNVLTKRYNNQESVLAKIERRSPKSEKLLEHRELVSKCKLFNTKIRKNGALSKEDFDMFIGGQQTKGGPQAPPKEPKTGEKVPPQTPPKEPKTGEKVPSQTQSKDTKVPKNNGQTQQGPPYYLYVGAENKYADKTVTTDLGPLGKAGITPERRPPTEKEKEEAKAKLAEEKAKNDDEKAKKKDVKQTEKEMIKRLKLGKIARIKEFFASINITGKNKEKLISEQKNLIAELKNEGITDKVEKLVNKKIDRIERVLVRDYEYLLKGETAEVGDDGSGKAIFEELAKQVVPPEATNEVPEGQKSEPVDPSI